MKRGKTGMGMLLGGNSSQRAEINVTPMIDVLLVLIIIFLVITPRISRGLDGAIQQQAQDSKHREVLDDIVISISKDHALRINREPIDHATLDMRLRALYRAGAASYLFIRGDRELDFGEVAHLIDVAKGAGWERIGLMTQ